MAGERFAVKFLALAVMVFPKTDFRWVDVIVLA
jgi:hypothetical protein